MTGQHSLFDQPLPDRGRDVAPVGRRHPVTAKQAAERALPRTGSKRRRTVEMIAARGGLSCDEVEHLTGWSHQSASPIFTGLRDDGWIADTGERRAVRSSGNPAIVWGLTDRARRHLDEQERP